VWEQDKVLSQILTWHSSLEEIYQEQDSASNGHVWKCKGILGQEVGLLMGRFIGLLYL
jgi:hypothetical protein